MSSYETQSPGEGVQIEAVVKWFNLTKGFGFVAPQDNTPDAFLHMSVLARAGLQHVAEGTKLLVTIGDGPKGRQVLQILQILGMSEVPMESSRGGGGYGGGASLGPVEDVSGTVKWFKPDKGFGFVTPDDGGKDVFVHKTVVLRAGAAFLDPGQRVRMQIQTASKGREATQITLLD